MMALLKQSDQKYTSKPHVLVIDDDTRIRTLVSRYLHENDFIALTAESAEDAHEVMARFDCDVLVVDIMMPGQTGIEFTQSLRQKGQDIPILLLTALGEAEDRIIGLEVGADDYLPKPFEPKELVLRLKAILRRVAKNKKTENQFKIGKSVFDVKHDELKQGDDIVSLTTVEANLLRVLVESTGQILTRHELASRCNIDAGERAIDVQVTRLRRKIEENTKSPRFLQTVRGKGYVLRAERL